MKRSDITNQHVCIAYIEADRLNDSRSDKSLFTGDPVIFPYHLLMAWFPGCPFKIAYRAMERAFDDGLIEFGTSLRTGWLTDEGMEVAQGKVHVT